MTCQLCLVLPCTWLATSSTFSAGTPLSCIISSLPGMMVAPAQWAQRCRYSTECLHPPIAQVFCSIILFELFGSPFMRNASLVLSLLVGLIFSAIFTVNGNSFLTGEKIAASPAFTFLWVKRFPLGQLCAAVLIYDNVHGTCSHCNSVILQCRGTQCMSMLQEWPQRALHRS